MAMEMEITIRAEAIVRLYHPEEDRVFWEGYLGAFLNAPIRELVPHQPLSEDELKAFLSAHLDVGAEIEDLRFLESRLTRLGAQFVTEGNTHDMGWWGPTIAFKVWEIGDHVLVALREYITNGLYSDPIWYVDAELQSMPWETAELELRFVDPMTDEPLLVMHCDDMEGARFVVENTLALVDPLSTFDIMLTGVASPTEIVLKGDAAKAFWDLISTQK